MPILKFEQPSVLTIFFASLKCCDFICSILHYLVAVKNKQMCTFLITETIILVDGCKFSDRDGLDFTFNWVHDRGDRKDEHETSLRGTGMHLEYKMVT